MWGYGSEVLVLVCDVVLMWGDQNEEELRDVLRVTEKEKTYEWFASVRSVSESRAS